MSFMLLIVEQPGDRAGTPAALGHERYDRMVEFGKGLGKKLRAVESLLTDANAVRLSKRSGRMAALDGPFAEAKEMVGGFFLLDVATRDEALAIARECPAVEWATVEVREVGPCWTESVQFDSSADVARGQQNAAKSKELLE
ncbi:MAG: hypothetical protein J0H94_11105 [Rhizobiales bacterium]|nr:hypothetical protein [Hyphomicrobiales bacterium]